MRPALWGDGRQNLRSKIDKFSLGKYEIAVQRFRYNHAITGVGAICAGECAAYV